jgi:hypothetical protein
MISVFIFRVLCAKVFFSQEKKETQRCSYLDGYIYMKDILPEIQRNYNSVYLLQMYVQDSSGLIL